MKLIVIDPRKIDIVKSADKHLQIQVGTDIALINAMIRVIITEGLYDKGFIGKHTEEFDTLLAKVDRYTPDYSAAITGLAAEDIVEVARLYAGANRAMIAYTLGITEHHCGVNNVLDIANLTDRKSVV